jgi:hypothetical protein
MLRDQYRCHRRHVPGAGVEPARAEAHGILSPARLPVPPSRPVLRVAAGHSTTFGTLLRRPAPSLPSPSAVPRRPMSARGVVLAFVSLVPALAACSSPCCPAPAVPEVVAIQDGSVPDARSIVSPAVLALGLALEGAGLSMVALDTEGDDARAVAIAEAVASDRRVVAVVVAPFTRLPEEGRDGLLRSGVPVLSLSELVGPPNRRGLPFLTLVGSVRREGEALVGLAGGRRVCLAGDGSRPSTVLAAAVRRAATRPPRRVSLDSVAGCGSLIWTGSEPAVDAFVDTIGRTALVLGDAGRTDAVVRRAGGVHHRIVAACPCADVSTSARPAAQRFVHDYQAATGLDAGPYAVEGFDAGRILRSRLGAAAGRAVAASRLGGLSAFHGLAADYRWVGGSLQQPGVRSYRAVGVRWLSTGSSA